MAGTNQYTRRSAKPSTEVIRLQGTLQQRTDLLRQALEQHEQQVAQERLQQLQGQHKDQNFMRGWAPIAGRNGRPVFRFELPNRKILEVVEQHTDSWDTRYDGNYIVGGCDNLRTAIIRSFAVASIDSSLLGPDPTPQQLAGMASCPAEDAREQVARHRRTTAGLLLQLADDPHPDVRAAVARNRRCPAAALEKLLHDTDKQVAQTASEHPRCPRHLRAMYQLATQ